MVVRTPAAIVAAVFMPLVLMVVMTAGFAKVVNPSGSYQDYINQVLPLFVVMGVAFSAVTTGVAAHRDLHSGMENRLRTLPIAPAAPLAGRIIGDASRNLITLVVLGLAGAAIGFRFHAGIGGALGAVALALLVGSAFAWLAVAAALRASSAESVTSNPPCATRAAVSVLRPYTTIVGNAAGSPHHFSLRTRRNPPAGSKESAR